MALTWTAPTFFAGRAVQLTTYARAQAFLADHEAYLLQNEVVNALILGLATRLAAEPLYYGSEPYFAAAGEPGSPALCALMTPPYNLNLYAAGESSPDALALIAHDLLAGGWLVSGVLARARLAASFAAVWSRLAGQSARIGLNERLYELRQVLTPAGVPGYLRPAHAADTALLAQWLDDFQTEAQAHGPPRGGAADAARRIAEGSAFFWEDGAPVSLAGTSRPTRHGISVGPVYTPPRLRRRGYASACVAVLSRRLLDRGFAYCTLFTNLANPTSNAIYQAIGYRQVCDFQEYKFAGLPG